MLALAAIEPVAAQRIRLLAPLCGCDERVDGFEAVGGAKHLHIARRGHRKQVRADLDQHAVMNPRLDLIHKQQPPRAFDTAAAIVMATCTPPQTSRVTASRGSGAGPRFGLARSA